jgi:hypothetical protein
MSSGDSTSRVEILETLQTLATSWPGCSSIQCAAIGLRLSTDDRRELGSGRSDIQPLSTVHHREFSRFSAL